MPKPLKWKFKKNAKPQGEGDFWYDLTDGGYIEPEAVLIDKNQITALKDAIVLIRSFQIAMSDAELLNDV